MDYKTIQVKIRENVCFVRFVSLDKKNCINSAFISELTHAFMENQDRCSVMVLEGNESYFCYGANFREIGQDFSSGGKAAADPAPTFDLWKMMTELPCIVISHVQGAANAGGMGFLGASDVVIASDKASFSLSELLFGLMPAMVLPFLIRRIGFSKTNFMSITTKPISCEQAAAWGLVDILSEQSEVVLRQLIARVSKIPKDGIKRYKKYVNQLYQINADMRNKAIEANLQVFTDQVNLKRITEFSMYGKYPWGREN